MGETAPALEQFLKIPVRHSFRTASLKRRPCCSEATFSNVIGSFLNAFRISPVLLRLHATIHTQTV
ncbi:MAG: hypothetical protein Q7U92_17170, partial [Bradyrhizobium sp.]|nr:hypothetical protein [Bradyrhizobium sp.]